MPHAVLPLLLTVPQCSAADSAPASSREGLPTTAMLMTTEEASRAHTAQRGTSWATERLFPLSLVTVLGGSELVSNGRKLSLKPVAARPDSCSP